jgi:hypothetical protein
MSNFNLDYFWVAVSSLILVLCFISHGRLNNMNEHFIEYNDHTLSDFPYHKIELLLEDLAKSVNESQLSSLKIIDLKNIIELEKFNPDYKRINNIMDKSTEVPV